MIGVLPLLLLIVATLGSILAGLATPTEAAGIGALGALILAVVYRRLTYAGLKQACISATLTSSMVLLLAVTSNIFGAVFARMGRRTGSPSAHAVAAGAADRACSAFVVVLIFLLGWPFEWPAIILVFLPIFYPVVDALRRRCRKPRHPDDLFMVWFGALVAVTMQTAYLSPPVAMSAYYLKQVVKEWSLRTIYKGMFEFMVLQCIAIAVVMFVPGIATYLPEVLQDRAAEPCRPRTSTTAPTGSRRTRSRPGRNSEEEEQQGDSLEKDAARQSEEVAVFCYKSRWRSISMPRWNAPAPGARAGSAMRAATSSRCGSPTAISARRPRCSTRSRPGSPTGCSAIPPRRPRSPRRSANASSGAMPGAWSPPGSSISPESSPACTSRRASSWHADGHVLVPRPVYQHLKRAAELAPRRFTEIPLVLDRGPLGVRPAGSEAGRRPLSVQSAEPRRHGVPPPGARAARRGERSRDHRVRRDPLRPGPRPGAAPRADCEPFTRGLAPHGHADVGEQDLQFPCRRLRVGDHRGRPAAARVRRRHRAHVLHSPSVFGYDATLAAFRGGDAWLAAQLEYLRGNRDLVERTPAVTDGSRRGDLSRLDRLLDAGSRDAYEYFLQPGVALSPGPQFGGSAGFVRLNFATQRARLAEALARMRAAAARPAPR